MQTSVNSRHKYRLRYKTGLIYPKIKMVNFTERTTLLQIRRMTPRTSITVSSERSFNKIDFTKKKKLKKKIKNYKKMCVPIWRLPSFDQCF